eukprot:TRINITY_DN9860_c0_g1_i1.p1 TRINITY_DN9860_c0_g1~~TRINITY_DN9860_c0_g1_i1.p1  ORF type:complete len:1285 (+),score=277.27 TRINITY_DN9860_c0_g1_i1:43-3897(+)
MSQYVSIPSASKPISSLAGKGLTENTFRRIYHGEQENVGSNAFTIGRSDEGDITMIQHQIAQVQSMRMESERKDSIINELKQQVSELLKHKEQALNLRAQLALFEERSKLRETESSFKIGELQEQVKQLQSAELALKTEISRLEDIQVRSEESKSQLLQQLRRQQYEVEGSMRTENERWTMIRAKLEGDLKIALETVDSQRETISRMNAQLRTLREHQEAANAANAQKETVEQEKNQMQATILSLQSQLSALQDKLQKANRDAGMLDEYKREVDHIPALHSEIRALNLARNELADQLHAERASLKSLEDEKKRWKDLYQETEKRMRETNHQLEQQLIELRSQLVTLSGPVKELSDKKQQVELLTEELARQRANASKITTDHLEMKSQYTEIAHLLDMIMSEVPGELASLARLLEYAKAHGQLDPDEVPAQPLSHALGTLKNMIYGLRSRVIEICTEVVNTKDANRGLLLNIEARERRMEDLANEIDECQKSIFELKAQHAVAVEQKETLTRECTDMKNKISQLQSSISSTESDVDIRNQFIFVTLNRLVEQMGTLPDLHPSSTVSLAANWEVLQHVFSDSITQLLGYTRGVIAQLQASLRDRARIEEMHNHAVQNLQNLQDETRRQKDLLMSQHQEEIKSMRNESKATLDDLHTQLTRLTDQVRLFESQTQKSGDEAFSLGQELNYTRELANNLIKALGITLRGLKSADSRTRELASQKRYLSSRVSTYDKLTKDLCDLGSAVNGDFGATKSSQGSGSSRRGFRVAAISVLAALRLQRNLQTPLYGKSVPAGVERIYVARSEDMSFPQEQREFAEAILTIMATAESDGRILANMRAKFDPNFQHTDRLVSRSLLFWINRQPSAGYKSKQSAAEKSVAIIRRATLQLTKLLRETEKEKERLKQKNEEYEETNAKRSRQVEDVESLLAKEKEHARQLESQLTSVQSDLSYMVSADKYRSVLQSHEELIQAYRELKEDQVALQNEYDAQFSLLASLKQSLTHAEQELEAQSGEVSRLRRLYGDKEKELTSTNDYLKQKAQQIVVVEDARKHQTLEIASLHAQIDKLTMDKQAAESQITLFQSELDERRNTIAKLEATLLEAERQRQTESEKVQRLQSEVNRRERELANCQELITALTDAHQKSAEKAKTLQYEVDSYRGQVEGRAPQPEYSKPSRPFTEDKDTDDMAKARLELLNLRASAEAELHKRSRGAPSAFLNYRDEHDLRQYVTSLNRAINRTQVVDSGLHSRGETRPSSATIDKRPASPSASHARPSRLGQQLTRTFQTVL